MIDMAKKVRHIAFEDAHPVVGLLYFISIALFSMFVMHPVFVLIQVIASFVFGVCCVGWRTMLRSLRWQLPVLVLVSLSNPLFNRSGLTTLLTVGPIKIQLEALVYGLCMAGMLLSVLQWLSNAAAVLTEDKILGLGASRLPAVSLMVSMTAQLTPQLLRRSHQVSAALDACSAAAVVYRPQDGPQEHGTKTTKNKNDDVQPTPKLAKRLSRIKQVRIASVLMGWALEDSLERADAMRARGWGAKTKHSQYHLVRAQTSDYVWAVTLVFSILICLYICIAALQTWVFYPLMSHVVPWWGYAFFAYYAFLPSLVTLVQNAYWKSLD